jgi:hypothetical protein
MKGLIILFLFSLNAFTDDLTITKFKEILNGKETENIRKELKQLHIMKKCNVRFTMNYPNKDPFQVSTTATEKYVANKYIVTIIKVPDNKAFYSIILWNDKDKSLDFWLMDPSEKITRFKGTKDKKRKNRIHWKGKTTSNEDYEGYTDYSQLLISWEGKYTNPDGTSYTESGNSTPIK